MPLVRITYPRGALTQEHKRALASELTDVVLDAEVDAITPSGKMVTVVQFLEVAADDWAVGGQLRSDAADRPSPYVVDVIVLEGLLEGARRGDVHRRVTEGFRRALGDGDPSLPLRVWVLVHEVREGSWGVAGRTVSALDVAQFLQPKLDPARRAEIAEAIARRAKG